MEKITQQEIKAVDREPNLEDLSVDNILSYIEQSIEGGNEMVGLNSSVAIKLIEAGESYFVARNLRIFDDLNKDVATALIKEGKGGNIACNFKRFQESIQQDLFLELIEVGEAEAISNSLERFENINRQILALKLIEKGFGSRVLEGIDGLNQDVALALIDKGYSIAGYFKKLYPTDPDKFQDVDLQEILVRSLDGGERFAIDVAENLVYLIDPDYFEEKESLTKADLVLLYKIEEALMYFDADLRSERLKYSGPRNKEAQAKIREVLSGKDWKEDMSTIFETQDDNELVLKVLEDGFFDAALDRLGQFKDLRIDAALAFMEKDKGGIVARCIDSFAAETHREIVGKLIQSDNVNGILSAVSNLQKFVGVDDLHPEIASNLIRRGWGSSLADSIEKFKNINLLEVAQALIETDQGVYVAEHIDKFIDTDKQDKGESFSQVELDLLRRLKAVILGTYREEDGIDQGLYYANDKIDEILSEQS